MRFFTPDLAGFVDQQAMLFKTHRVGGTKGYRSIYPVLRAVDSKLLYPSVGGPDATAINHAAYIYSARNVAVGLAFIIAYFLKKGPMLFILIFIRLFTDLIDLPTFLSFGLFTNEASVAAIFVFLYYIPAVIALRYLWKQMTYQKGD